MPGTPWYVRRIKIPELRIEVEGEIDLPGFPGLEPPADLNMDRHPGFKNVIARVQIDAGADVRTLHDHAVKTSPVGITLTRLVTVKAELDVVRKRSDA